LDGAICAISLREGDMTSGDGAIAIGFTDLIVIQEIFLRIIAFVEEDSFDVMVVNVLFLSESSAVLDDGSQRSDARANADEDNRSGERREIESILFVKDLDGRTDLKSLWRERGR
jgi:hypothetical protein